MKIEAGLPDLHDELKRLLKRKDSNFTKLARQLGMSYPGLMQQFKQRNFRILQLIRISKVMNINLLEKYEDLLPHHLHETGHKRSLHAEIQQLRQQLEAKDRQMAAQREKYEFAIEQLTKRGT